MATCEAAAELQSDDVAVPGATTRRPYYGVGRKTLRGAMVGQRPGDLDALGWALSPGRAAACHPEIARPLAPVPEIAP